MKDKKPKIINLILIFFFLLVPLKLVKSQNLLIVEVQISGEESSNDFIKIYNLSDQDLDISGYKLRKRTVKGNESSIRLFPPGSKISRKGYFLWANSKDNYHLKRGADSWSQATLAQNNSIALLSPENRILDALAWGEGKNQFFEGQPFPKNPAPNQKLERKRINGVYQDTNNNADDFYLSSSQKEKENENKISSGEKKELKENELSPVYPEGILLNEILPNTPFGSRDEEGEYIEIFNQNNFEINLAGWKIEDIAGKTTIYIFQEEKVSPRGFLVLYRPLTKIILNNDGDGLNLIQPDGKIVDSVSYEKAPPGQSYNRTFSGWVWSSVLTPNSENIISDQRKETKIIEESKEEIKKIDINTASVKELEKIVGIGPVLAKRIIEARPFYSLDELTKVSGLGPKSLEEIKKQGLAWVDPQLKPSKIKGEEISEKGLAKLSEPLLKMKLNKEFPKSLSLFLIALTLSIFSGIIILILKKSLKEK